MKFYSTNKHISNQSLHQAVVKGLAADKGLFMPNTIEQLPPSFFQQIEQLSFQELSFRVAQTFFANAIPSSHLKQIVYDTLNFDCPLVEVAPNIYSLELFHGPTAAFKDVGARFMARILRYFLKDSQCKINVLVATSGDTGSAVANGFYNVEGVNVYVLYPKGKVSPMQEKQFATLHNNIYPIQIDGTFDHCQSLVKQAFADEELNQQMLLTSANSINIARFFPQSFYYFHAYAQLRRLNKPTDNIVFSVPSGNFGNLTAGLFAQQMGLPVSYFIAANNQNDVVYKYLENGVYEPKTSVQTIASAMDVGAPSNFARILDLFDHNWATISQKVKGARFTDQQIRNTIAQTHKQSGYILDPHGACAYQALVDLMEPQQIGVFLETAHPAKFIETVAEVLPNQDIAIPDSLKAFQDKTISRQQISANYSDFKALLTGL